MGLYNSLVHDFFSNVHSKNSTKTAPYFLKCKT
jgi:hypothetical protein